MRRKGALDAFENNTLQGNNLSFTGWESESKTIGSFERCKMW